VLLALGVIQGLTAAAVSVLPPLILQGALHTCFTTERLSWSVGTQAGTDFTAFGALYNIGRTAGVAVLAPAVLLLGWPGYFGALAVCAALLCGLFAFAQPRIANMQGSAAP
jgi:hypothetical protein